jgi:hypothetical protein
VIEYVARFLSKPESLIGMLGISGKVLYPVEHYIEEILLVVSETEDRSLLKTAFSRRFPDIKPDDALNSAKRFR